MGMGSVSEVAARGCVQRQERMMESVKAAVSQREGAQAHTDIKDSVHFARCCK